MSEPIIGGGEPAPESLIKDSTDQNFMVDVVEESRETPVIVDFWAPWCGPCKQLGPMLEKLVKAGRGSVKLVKINIDENPHVAQQLRVQSIPAVFAFKEGQPVDAFMGALPESQLKEFIERLGGAAGPSPFEQLMEEAAAAMEKGDHQGAGQLYGAAVQEEPGNPEAAGGLARCFIEMGNLDQAEQALGLVTKENAEHPAIAGARSALALAREAAGAGDVSGLRAAIEANPKDHQARYDLAIALLAGGDRDGAVEQLLTLLKLDRNWNDQAARKKLIELFDAFGPTDPLTLDGRRRMSSILFA
ncbi:MAG TPA: thioredoxin [Alphaproteobacteria bacterium]|nr:thioredoxin [Alphaproteobacteria bacterium]